MKSPTPFRYPKWMHVRKLNPGPYKSYKSYRPHLQDEFCRKCIYCRLPDGLNTTFGVEHYWPKKNFPHLVTTYSNLFYACNRCNSYKGNFWPTNDDIKNEKFVPNPCDHTMSDHVWFEDSIVIPKDKVGAFAEDLLDLNNEERVLFREFILRAIHRAVAEGRKINRSLRKIDKTLKISTSPEKVQDLSAAKRELEAELATVMSDLQRLTGENAITLPK